MLSVVEIDKHQRLDWDDAVASFPIAHPLNAFGWGNVRAVDGWRAAYLMAKRDGMVAGAIMILTKTIPGTGFCIMYAPKGPIWDPSDNETLKALVRRIHSEAQRSRAIFLRIDPHIREDFFDSQHDPFIQVGFIHLEHRWSFWNSPRDVSRIDLSNAQNPEEIFNRLDRDTRRCIRKAKDRGVTIRAAEQLRDLEIFYDIFKQFSVRKGFMARGYAYQKKLWNEFIVPGNGRLFLAVYQGKIIGGLICLIFGKKCLAMHMGTPYEYHALHTNYAYVWESIRWAKEKGCLWYSFRGVGTTPTQERFKKKFRPQVVSLVGYYDLPFRPALYRLWSLSEFELLPRAWATAMKARQTFNNLFDQRQQALVRS